MIRSANTIAATIGAFQLLRHDRATVLTVLRSRKLGSIMCSLDSLYTTGASRPLFCLTRLFFFPVHEQAAEDDEEYGKTERDDSICYRLSWL